MAQDLKYIIKPELDSATAKVVRDQLNALEKSARTLGGGGGGGGGGDPDKGEESKETKELALVLDELTQKYLENAQALVDMNLKIGEYRTQLKELSEAKRVNKGLTDEELEQEQAIRTALRDTTGDYNAKAREMIVLQQENEALGNSYFEIEKRMKAISVQIKSLDLDTQGEEVKRLTAEYNGLNTRLKEVDSGMGNNQRSVGDYENSIRSAAGALAVFQGPLGPVAGRINAFATALTRFEKEAMAGSKSALFLANAMKLLYRAALPLLTAFLALFQFFTRTEEGQQKLRVGMAMLMAVVDTLRDMIIGLGKNLVEIFTNPIESIKSLVDTISNYLLGSFKLYSKAVGLLFAGFVNGAKGAGLAIKGIFSEEARQESEKYFAQAKKDFEDFGDSASDFYKHLAGPITAVVDGIAKTGNLIADNVKHSKALETAMNAVLVKERELGVERAKQDRDMQQAREAVRDLSKSFEERFEALARVRESEMSLSEQELANEQERERIMKAQLDQFASKEEAFNAFAEQEAKVLKLQEENAMRLIRFNRDYNSLLRAQGELLLRESKRALDTQIRESQAKIMHIEREYKERGMIVELAEARLREFNRSRAEEERLLFEQYKQELVNQYDDELTASKHFEEAKARAKHEIELKYIGLKNNVDDAVDQRNQSAINAKLTNEALARQTALNDEVAALALRNDTLGQIEAQQRALDLEREAEHQVKVLALKKSLIAQGLNETLAGKIAEERITGEYTEREREIDRQKAEAIKRNREELLNATVELAKTALTTLFGDNKKVAIAVAIIDTLAAMTNALKNGPTPLALVNAATIGLAGFANVRKIMSTRIDSKDTSPPATSTPAPQKGFGLVDLPRAQSGTGNLIATQTAGMTGPAGMAGAPVIILDGEFDKEALAVKVRKGNNAISSRSIRIGA